MSTDQSHRRRGFEDPWGDRRRAARRAPFYLALVALAAAALLLDALLHVFNAVWIGRYLGIPGTLRIIGSFGHSLRKRKLISAGKPVTLQRSRKRPEAARVRLQVQGLGSEDLEERLYWDAAAHGHAGALRFTRPSHAERSLSHRHTCENEGCSIRGGPSMTNSMENTTNGNAPRLLPL